MTSDTTILVGAIRRGDLNTLGGLLDARPALASSQLGGEHGTRTPLHVVADWPGYFPNGPRIVQILAEHGADPNVRVATKTARETPLHWAASSDDSDVARALIDIGADVNAVGGSIGTPLGNAVGYACWNVARLLLERGAAVDELWHAAALGLLDRVEELAPLAATQEDLSTAFWHACAGGQRRVAEYLRARGADINRVPNYSRQTALEIAAAPDTRREGLVSWLRDQGARESSG